MNEHLVRLDELARQFRNGHRLWEDKYTVKSPISGTLSVVPGMVEKRTVAPGETLTGIVPEDTGGGIVARLRPAAANIGKVEISERALLRLDASENKHYISITIKTKSMTFNEQLDLMERMHLLIRRKATGTPEAFAQKLGYSERQVFRLINTMKERGFPIVYCKQKRTYFYEKEVKFQFEVSVIGEKEKQMARGGRFYMDFEGLFFGLTKNVSLGAFLWGR